MSHCHVIFQELLAVFVNLFGLVTLCSYGTFVRVPHPHITSTAKAICLAYCALLAKMPALQLRDNKTNRHSSWDSQQLDFPAAYLMSWPQAPWPSALWPRDLTDDRRDENSTWVYVPCPSLFHLDTRVLLVDRPTWLRWCWHIPWRIHGAGIYANIGDILMGSMLPYIAAPWIRHGYAGHSDCYGLSIANPMGFGWGHGVPMARWPKRGLWPPPSRRNLPRRAWSWKVAAAPCRPGRCWRLERLVPGEVEPTRDLRV